MQNRIWMLAASALLAWTSLADAQSFALPFSSAMSAKNPAATSAPVGLPSFFGHSMQSSRPNTAPMFGFRPSIPSAFSLTNIFPSFSGITQNTMLPRAPQRK